MIRKLVSLYQEPSKDWKISFGYYMIDNGSLKFTGKSEYAHLTEDEFYQLIKPRLKRRED